MIRYKNLVEVTIFIYSRFKVNIREQMLGAGNQPYNVDYEENL
jgi:hypothetical protein